MINVDFKKDKPKQKKIDNVEQTLNYLLEKINLLEKKDYEKE